MPSLPKQVVQDMLDIEEMEKQYVVQTPPADPPPDETPVDPPAAEAKPEGEQQKPKASTPEVDPNSPTWEQRFRSLQGKFDSEVPVLARQNKELLTQIEDLRRKVETKVEPQTPPKAESFVTDKDVTEYGAELIDVQRRVAKEVMAPLQELVKQRDAEIAELKTMLTKTGGEVAAVTFEQRLSQAIPEFAKINSDPKWIAFLDEPDPYTMEPRRVFAEYAYNNGNVDKLKGIIDFFKTTTGQNATPAVDERQLRQAELERQITPTRANSQPSTAPTAQTRIYTEGEMVSLFSQVRGMNVAGKYDEAAKLEAELSDAYVQGRVRG